MLPMGEVKRLQPYMLQGAQAYGYIRHKRQCQCYSVYTRSAREGTGAHIFSPVTFSTVIEIPFMSSELINVPVAAFATVMASLEKYCIAALAHMFSSIRVDVPRLLIMITTRSTRAAIRNRIIRAIYHRRIAKGEHTFQAQVAAFLR